MDGAAETPTSCTVASVWYESGKGPVRCGVNLGKGGCFSFLVQKKKERENRCMIQNRRSRERIERRYDAKREENNGDVNDRHNK